MRKPADTTSDAADAVLADNAEAALDRSTQQFGELSRRLHPVQGLSRARYSSFTPKGEKHGFFKRLFSRDK
jgi:hypothetical protein